MPDAPLSSTIVNPPVPRHQAVLTKAREREEKRNGYSSEAYRTQLANVFRERVVPGADLRSWQADICEAIHLKLDCILVSPTGSGKTVPFFLPLLADADKTSKVIVISPLIELQHDMQAQITAAGVKAIAVNGSTWSLELQKDLLAHDYQLLLIGPEMMIDHKEFVTSVVKNQGWMRTVKVIVVDEVHCMSQWGAQFRKRYADLAMLRSFVPLYVPILAASATLPPRVLCDVRKKLGLFTDRLVQFNLGNDRGNITEIVHVMKSAQDKTALEFLVDEAHRGEALIRTIVYVEERDDADIIANYLESLLPAGDERYQGKIEHIHAMRNMRARRRVMENFQSGKTDIVVSTEVTGMGANLRGVRRIVQFGVPRSLVEYNQHKGRAGRDQQPAVCVFLVQPSTYTIKGKTKEPAAAQPSTEQAKQAAPSQAPQPQANSKKRNAPARKARRRKRGRKAVNIHVDESESDAGETDNKIDEIDGDEMDEAQDKNEAQDGVTAETKYARTVEPDLRKYLDATQCRRRVSNKIFGSIPAVLTVPCCDLCLQRRSEEQNVHVSEEERILLDLIVRLDTRKKYNSRCCGIRDFVA